MCSFLVPHCGPSQTQSDPFTGHCPFGWYNEGPHLRGREHLGLQIHRDHLGFDPRLGLVATAIISTTIACLAHTCPIDAVNSSSP